MDARKTSKTARLDEAKVKRLSHIVRPQQAFSPSRQNNGGYTLIEVLEFTLGGFLALWLAAPLANQFHGVWRPVAFWAAVVVGTLMFGFSITIGRAYGLAYIDLRRGRKTPHESGKSDTSGEKVVR